MVGETITLEYKMLEGETLRYKTEVISEQTIKEDGKPPESGRSVLEMTMIQAVKGVSPDGLMTVDVTIQEGTISKDNQTAPLPSVGQTIQIVMKKNGDIVRTSVEFPFSQPAFPENQLKVNDNWTGESKMEIPLYDNDGNPAGKKDVTLHYTYTLGGFEHVSGYDTAVIKVSCPSTTIQLQEGVEQKINATGTTNFGYRQGRLVASKVETSTEITAPGTTVSTRIRVNVVLLEASGGSGGGFSGPEEQFIIR
ncbi:hypothetical protein DYH09_08205 [bacterium CPR1]|nr:hypothetical protein [bacterium CPR1]